MTERVQRGRENALAWYDTDMGKDPRKWYSFSAANAAFLLVFALTACTRLFWMWIQEYNAESELRYRNAKRVAHTYENNPHPTAVIPTRTPMPTPDKSFTDPLAIDWSQYGNTALWKAFNADYSAPERNFRFRYPRAFEVFDNDSGSVWMYVRHDGREVVYMTIEEANLNSGERVATYRERLLATYTDDDPPLADADLLPVRLNDSSIEAYKVEGHGRGSCGLGSPDRDTWFCYYAQFPGHGISMFVSRPVPDSIVVSILNSVRFK